MEAERNIEREDSATMAEITRGRANLYHWLVRVFGHLPDRDLILKIKSRDFRDLLENCYSLDNSRLNSGIDYVKSYRASMKLKPDEEILNELSIDRTRLLRITGATSLKPPYEGLYKNNRGASVLELKKCYREAGLLPDETVVDSPDFLCIELDFMYHLCCRELEQRTSTADVTETVAYEEKFLREHLGSWVGEFCSHAENHAVTDFYRGFFAILDAVVSMDLAYLSNLMPAL